MSSIVSIRPKEKIDTEVEKEETKLNILYLMMVLIGVQLAETIDRSVGALVEKIEKLKEQYNQNKKEIDALLGKLQSIETKMESLKSDPSTLPELKALKLTLERVQDEYQGKVIKGADIQGKLSLTAKVDLTPLYRTVEILEAIAAKFLRVIIEQMSTR